MNTLNKELINKIYNDYNSYSYYLYDYNILDKYIQKVTNYMPDNFSLYYAIKANPNMDILKYIKEHEKIKGFEIASTGELNKSLKYCKPDEIIYTGPAKTEKELYEALKTKIRFINVESIVEAIRINNIAERLKIEKVNVLLRINSNYKIQDAAENMGGLSTKMGIDEEEFLDAYKYISNLEHINIVGLHVFSASGILNYKSGLLYVKYIFDLVKKYNEIRIKFDVIDFGGGLGVDYSGNNKEFDTKSYFKKLKKMIDEYSFNNKEFVLELGCFLVATAGYYLTKIIDIKKSKNFKHIILAGGLNHIPTATLNGKHPFEIINMNNDNIYEFQEKVEDEQVDIDGPLCTAEDKVLWDVHVNSANIGDVIIIKQAGAYCYSAAWLDFLSHQRPIELSIKDGIIKKI